MEISAYRLLPGCPAALSTLALARQHGGRWSYERYSQAVITHN
jgi:hypothetical protein